MTARPEAAWHTHAEALADWTLAHLANRVDVWGCYVAPERRALAVEGRTLTTWTAPSRRLRGQVRLSRAVLRQHFAAGDGGDVIGLHSTSPENTSRWLAFDVDAHDDTPDRRARNQEAARQLTVRLLTDRLTPLIEDSNGAGGFHLWVLFAAPVSTAGVYAYATALLAELGLACETFPKQPTLGPGQLGNWLRLPGLHHTRPHWSRLSLAGARWQEGAAAVRALLDAPLHDPALLPAAPAPALAREREAAPQLPRPRAVWVETDDRLERRIRGYLDRLPVGLRAGEGRNNIGYQFACWLTRDLQLDDVLALTWLAEWNARQGVPMSEAKLRSLITEAHRYGQRPYGGGLTPAPSLDAFGGSRQGEGRFRAPPFRDVVARQHAEWTVGR